MKTGFIIRTQEDDGKWVSKDIVNCTEGQIRNFFATKEKDFTVAVIIEMCAKMGPVEE